MHHFRNFPGKITSKFGNRRDFGYSVSRESVRGFVPPDGYQLLDSDRGDQRTTEITENLNISMFFVLPITLINYSIDA